MGYTSYSNESRSVRAESMSFYSKPVTEITSKKLTQAMSPKGIVVRESRDSDEHPNSVAVMVALDVTGSMMQVPQHFIRDGMPTLMTNIIQGGTPDPQVMFLGVGDHECDNAPLQVGQFESGDEELDKWLTEIYLERGGGANDGESYMLPWYLAAFHTSIDCYEKRGQKGFLFTIGDEPVLPHVSDYHLEKIFGEGQYKTYTTKELLEEAQKRYNVYHIHTKETGAGRRPDTEDRWKKIIGQNLITVESHLEIPQKISEIVLKGQESSSKTITVENNKEESSNDDITML